MQLLIVSLALLASGAGLFFLSHDAQPLWPWEIEPFNMLFLGAIYLASLSSVVVLLWYGRWSPARLVLPMLFVFTATVLLVSLMYIGRFDFARWSSWLWFMLYASLPLSAALHLRRHRTAAVAESHPTPAAWRAVLLVLAALLGVYGLAMFVAPGLLTAFWPWPVDAFHGRLYSVVFTTAAVGAMGLALVAAPVERLTLGLAYTILGLFAIFSVVISDARLGSVDPAQPGTWLWFSMFGLLFSAGLFMVWWSSITPEARRR
jgi:hypothetical protein